MSIEKRVNYLKGLVKGLDLGHDTKEEKILHVMVEILEDMAAGLEEVVEDIATLDDDVSVLFEDMQELEEFFFEHGADALCPCPVPPAPLVPVYEEEDIPDDPEPALSTEPQFFMAQCPVCDTEITIGEDVLGLGTIGCPSCGERLELEE